MLAFIVPRNITFDPSSCYSPSTIEQNPFGDGDSGDEQASQGSGSGSARKSPEPGSESGAVMSIPARVIYAYQADEDDEISADAGNYIPCWDLQFFLFL